MFKQFDLDDIKSKFQNQAHKVIYLNYDRAGGMKILKDIGQLSYEELKFFHNLYIFNDELMISAFFFDGEDIRYSEIRREDFITSEIKEYYLQKCSYKKLQVRIGTKADGTVRTQYIDMKGEA